MNVISRISGRPDEDGQNWLWRASSIIFGAAVFALVTLTLASVPFRGASWLAPAYYAAIPAALVAPALPAAIRAAEGRGPAFAVVLGVVPGAAWALAVVVARGVSRALGRSLSAGDAPLWGVVLYFVVAGVVVALVGFTLGRVVAFLRRRR
ncbi:hypothetical protein [Halobaculum limi]|uniref:hypothetical protein n=1 Tax=Halobaculum limi TaxID=3031916 RepID=UPI002404A03C|nr:hypothetical protein [Halobaculum sp. YSMS11]